MAILNDEQTQSFRERGWCLVPGLIDEAARARLLAELDGWVDESRAHNANFGFDTPNGKARFDLEDGHSADRPKLRRVANPCDISAIYADLVLEGSIPAAVAELIGPDVVFHHCKLNNKFPGMETRVNYHQDHPYDPHTNDDGITVLLMLDDMNDDNGCLRIVPGSHRERPTHFRDGKFVGTTDPALYDDYDARAESLVGKAGDVALMDIWSLHGGGPNRSQGPRRMMIADYRAADAFPLTPPAVPSMLYRTVVAGHATHVARFRAGTCEVLEPYDDDSFFGLLGQKAAGSAKAAS